MRFTTVHIGLSVLVQRQKIQIPADLNGRTKSRRPGRGFGGPDVDGVAMASPDILDEFLVGIVRIIGIIQGDIIALIIPDHRLDAAGAGD